MLSMSVNARGLVSCRATVGGRGPDRKREGELSRGSSVCRFVGLSPVSCGRVLVHMAKLTTTWHVVGNGIHAVHLFAFASNHSLTAPLICRAQFSRAVVQLCP
jgi:hypothetical protein